MSSSFVKDCSDVSAGRNTNYIIIVDSDTGNVALDGDSIQNLLANQVSVLHLGGADAHENYNEELAENSATIPVSTDGATHVNVTLEGFSSIPIGGDGSSGNYAELPLDADAFQRLESVLESEEAREILGEPLLNMVADPDNLGSLDQLLDPNILAGDSLNETMNEGDSSIKKGSEASCANNTKEARRSPPMRRSQRQQDKATKEEVEKILAENQRQFKEEKAKMKEKNISTQKNEHAEENKNEEIQNEGIEEDTESQEDTELQEDGPTTRRARGRGRGWDKKTEVGAALALTIPRGSGRIRGRVKNTVLEKDTEDEPTVRKGQGLEGGKNNAEMRNIEVEPKVARGRFRGRNKTDKEKEERPAVDARPSRGRGSGKSEEVLPVDKHKGRGKGRGRFQRLDILDKPGDMKIKNLEVTVEKIGVVEAKDISAEDEMGEEKICETNNLLTSKTLAESNSTNSSQDITKKDVKVYLNQSQVANNIKNSETLKENGEAKHLNVSKAEVDNVGSEIVENIIKLEDKEQKKGSIASGKQKENSEAEEKINKDIDKENLIENKEKLQTIQEDSAEDPSKLVKNTNKQNYQPSTRSKIIQVKNITEVKQIVMLNSVTSLRSERGGYSEPLVKVIPLKDLPPDEKYEKGRRKPAKDIVQSTIKAPITPKKESQKRAITTTKTQTSPRSVDDSNPVMEESTSTVRRSGRAIKKKTFGDEMVTYDDKEDDVIGEVDEADFKDSEEESTDEEDDEDPERLWCICQKPHNNRFMICCDKCEDWFHGSCVGITKAMGQQMENESQEWVCPKCKKAERALKGQSSPAKTIATETSPGKSKEEEKIEVKPTDVKAYIIQKSEVKEKKEEYTCSASTASTSGKSEPRVLVYEKMTGKVLTGNMAPTLSHLKIWLKEHPEYAVLQPGMMGKAVSSVNKIGCGVTAIKTMEGAIAKDTIMKVSPTGPSQDKATATPSQAVSIPTSTSTITTADVDSTALDLQQFHSQKKIIQLSTQTVPATTSQEVKKNNVITSGDSTIIVNSADGKVTVKTGPPEPKKKVQKNFLAALNATTPSKQMAVEHFYRNSSTITTPKNKTIETVQESTTAKTALKKELSQDSTAIKTSLKKEDSATKKNDEKEIKKVPSQIKPKAPSNLPKPPKADPNEIRNNIRKSLTDCLSKRYFQVKKELPNINEETIAELAKEIELQLYNIFNKDVGFKYKSRYRSLVFNINDTKNSGLFRKILKGDLKPERLAKMTSEELASKELAQWREMEEKKELKAIEKHELDMISLGNTYIMKSHKGEIEIDKDQYIRDRETAPETLNTLPQETPDVPEDSSNNHRNHVYDPNCKICNENKPIIKDVMSEKEKQKKEKEHIDGKPRDDKDKKDRRNSEKERETHRDKERDREKEKDREKDKDKDREKDRERSKEKDKTKKDKSDGLDKSKSSDKHRSHRTTEREKSRRRYSSEKDYERDKERYRKHSEKHKDRRDSKDERKDSKEEKRDTKEYKDSKDRYMSRDERKDSKDRHEFKEERKNVRIERKDSKDSRKEDKERKRRDSSHDSDWKRKHSESRSEDRKRHNSEKDKIRWDTDKDPKNYFEKRSVTDMKDTTVVSTSEDVVKVPVETAGCSEQPRPLDLEVQVPETSSTVIGSPELLEECFTPPYETGGPSRSQSPTFFSERPETPPTPSIAFPTSPGSPLDGSSSPPQQCFQEPTTPPLPDFHVATPPLPEARDFRQTSLTPPLHQEVTTPPLPQCAPATPPPPPSFPDDSDRLTPPPAKGAPQIVWKGNITQDMVAKFNAFAFAVSGKADFLTEDVPKGIEVCGRISPEMVWMYIAQMKKSGSKEILVVRFQPANEDEKLAYIALYSHLSKKKDMQLLVTVRKQ